MRLVEGLALRRPRPSVARVARQAALAAADHGWPAPSYSTVHAIVTDLDPHLVTLAHDGPTALRDRYELVYRRQSDRPNALWQADHTELDLLVLDAGPAVAVSRARRLLAGRRRLHPVPGGALDAGPVAGAAPGHLARDRPRVDGARPTRRAVRRPRQRLRQRPPRCGRRRPAHRTGALRGRTPAGPRQDRAVLRHRDHRAPAPAARAARPRPPGVAGPAHAAGRRTPPSARGSPAPTTSAPTARPGRRRSRHGSPTAGCPAPRTASSSSTCCS